MNRLARPRREASDRAWRLALRQLSRGRWLRWSIVGFGVAFGVGLAAIQLLPAAELTRESQRVGGLDYTFAMTHSYWPWRLLTLLTPDLFGNPAYGNFWGYDNYWENAAYIGVLPLGLVLVAIRQWWRWGRMKDEGGGMKDEARSVQHVEHYGPRSEAERGFTPFFLVVALVSVILAFGWFTQIYPFLFRTIPGFSLFQGPARWLSAFTIALCVLAAIGAESMLHGRGELRRSVKWIVVGSALIVAGVVSRATLAGLAATLSQKGMFPHETFPDATLRLGMLVAIGGLLLGLRPSSDDRRFRWWASAFAAVVAIDLLTAHAALNPAIDPAVYRLPTQSAHAAQAEGDGRMFMFDADDDSVRKQFGIRLPFSDFGPADVDRWMQFRETLIANTSMIDGYPSASNFDPLLIGHYLELRDAVNDLPMDAALRLLRLMHVGYVSSPRSLPLPIVARTPAATLYRIENTPPRAWIVPSARIEENALAILLDPAFDPLSEVVISPSGPGVVSIPNASRLTLHDLRFTISSLHDTPNTVTIRAASQADGYLILADTWYPGWRARVDGQPVAVLRANVAFRAVAFPAGEHTIEFRYEPDSVRLGAWISGVSAVVLAAGLVFTARPRR
ncbi:MAG TPA: YfhO family protein [Anaerolineae bacterium]